MRQCAGAGALTMGARRWRTRDYLCHLHCQGEDLESDATLLACQTQSRRELTVGCFEIALVAATETEARQVLRCMLKHYSAAHSVGHQHYYLHHFTALSLNQDWPKGHFNELHWLNTSTTSPMPWELLSELADTLHIHHFTPPSPDLQSPAHHYRWRNRQDLAAFWASLYQAREAQNILGLDWSSYATWSTGLCIGQVSAGWGTTPATAVAALLAEIKLEMHGHAAQALLVIEANHSFTLGDYANTLDLLGVAIGCEVIATGWQAANYVGYGLKLLIFAPV